ncbi:VOC family protein [Pararhodobacter sp.]|uniref:VOC family protein n=1 Tax=Pararhodobacter sp. TaxID=2127056 RepID=UPI002FDE6834
MFTHIMVGANDITAMVAFYDAVLAPLGLRRTTDVDATDTGTISPAGVIWQYPGQRWPQFALRHPVNGEPATAGNGVQIAFRCPSRKAVRRAWETALNRGGSDEGAPGDRPIYSDDFHAAYVRDPEGNKLCFLHCHAFSESAP